MAIMNAFLIMGSAESSSLSEAHLASTCPQTGFSSTRVLKQVLKGLRDALAKTLVQAIGAEVSCDISHLYKRAS